MLARLLLKILPAYLLFLGKERSRDGGEEKRESEGLCVREKESERDTEKRGRKEREAEKRGTEKSEREREKEKRIEK